MQLHYFTSYKLHFIIFIYYILLFILYKYFFRKAVMLLFHVAPTYHWEKVKIWPNICCHTLLQDFILCGVCVNPT